jgi:hypothetical protein
LPGQRKRRDWLRGARMAVLDRIGMPGRADRTAAATFCFDKSGGAPTSRCRDVRRTSGVRIDRAAASFRPRLGPPCPRGTFRKHSNRYRGQ